MVDDLRLLDFYAYLKRQFVKSHAVIIMYHRVSPVKDTWSNVQTLSPDRFQGDIEFFRQRYEILSLDRLGSYFREKKPLPPRSVVITFDDGYKDNYLYAYPILKKYGVPATIFLVTGQIGTDSLFWWDRVGYAIQNTRKKQLQLNGLGDYSLESDLDKSRARDAIIASLKSTPEERKSSLLQNLMGVCDVEIPKGVGSKLTLAWSEVREMMENGISFGAHTRTHPILTNVSLEEAALEICQSKRDIELNLGKSPTFFSYPSGKWSADVAKKVEEAGFVGAVQEGFRWVTAKSNLYTLSRIGMSPDPDISRALLSGFWGDLHGNVGQY